ncbi:MAG: GTP cyclohydrolase II [Bacteroidota bacterium]
MKRQAQTTIPTQWGNFKMVAYSTDINEPMPHLAMVHEDFNPEVPTLVRIHSECLTGDLFTSKRCDCGEQLDEAMRQAARHGGVVVYLRQEGRGIGLINKLKAYNLQDEGLNTIDANTHLGLEIDSRQYESAITILKDLKIKSINLLTNNPLKIKAIEDSDIEVKKRIALVIPPKAENLGYLKTKEELMGHLFHINGKAKSVS